MQSVGILDAELGCPVVLHRMTLLNSAHRIMDPAPGRNLTPLVHKLGVEADRFRGLGVHQPSDSDREAQFSAEPGARTLLVTKITAGAA